MFGMYTEQVFMFGMYLVPISIYKFKRHNNFKITSTVENKKNLHKIRLVTFQTYIMNEIFNFLEF